MHANIRIQTVPHPITHTHTSSHRETCSSLPSIHSSIWINNQIELNVNYALALTVWTDVNCVWTTIIVIPYAHTHTHIPLSSIKWNYSSFASSILSDSIRMFHSICLPSNDFMYFSFETEWNRSSNSQWQQTKCERKQNFLFTAPHTHNFNSLIFCFRDSLQWKLINKIYIQIRRQQTKTNNKTENWFYRKPTPHVETAGIATFRLLLSRHTAIYWLT